MVARLGAASFIALLLVAAPARATFRFHNGLIAFTRSDGSIAAVSPRGGSERTLISNARDPAWSCDGKHLAFDSKRSGGSELYVADADGGNVRQLTRRGTLAYAPAWSPDGKRLVFVRDTADGSGIYVINADGSRLRTLLEYNGYHAEWPSWSPNGKWIAYDFETAYGRRAELDLFVMHSNGLGGGQLTHTAADEGRPSWSPDGKRLVFDRRRKGSDDIFVLTLRTKRQRVLIGNRADDAAPVWSPDGRSVAFSRADYVHDQASIYLARASGRSVRRLTKPHPHSYRGGPAWQPLP